MTSCQGRNPLVKGHLWASNISPNIISYRADIIVELTDWYNDSKVLVLAHAALLPEVENKNLYFQRVFLKGWNILLKPCNNVYVFRCWMAITMHF